MSERPSFFVRLKLAFRILFDPEGAALDIRGWAAAPELPLVSQQPAVSQQRTGTESMPGPDLRAQGALDLLAILQREGRFLDFVEQDIAGFGDAEIGAAARVVHQGCRKAIRDRSRVEPILKVAEGTRLPPDPALDPRSIKLLGQVGSETGHPGVVRHPGWRISELKLPEAIPGADATLVFPAEVEL